MSTKLAQSTRPGDQGGFSTVVVVLSLGITAILVALIVGTTLKSGSDTNANVTNAPGVEEATALQAQQTLSTALTAVETAASSAGYDSLTVAELSASDPSISFVSGPSTDSTTVSVTVNGGSVTLADRSTDGTCWLMWKSATSATWYGAQANLSSCMAPALESTPSPGPVSSASIGWQQGSFPAA